MGPPLRYEPATFTQAAKDVCKAAWNISEVASTLYQHVEAAATPEIRSALAAAIQGCRTELYTAHQETERVSVVVRQAAGVLWRTDYHFGQQLHDGMDYDTRHNYHPTPFAPPYSYPQFGTPWLIPNGRLPGE